MAELRQSKKKPFYKKISFWLLIIIGLVIISTVKELMSDSEKNKVLIFDDKDIKVYLEDRLDTETPSSMKLTVENGTNEHVVLGVKDLKIDGVNHVIDTSEQEQELSDYLTEYANKKEVGDEVLEETDGYVSASNRIRYALSERIYPAQYDDSVSEDTVNYYYKLKDKRKRPYALTGELEFILTVYKTKEKSIYFATTNKNGNFDKLKKVDQVKVEISKVD